MRKCFEVAIVIQVNFSVILVFRYYFFPDNRFGCPFVSENLEYVNSEINRNRTDLYNLSLISFPPRLKAELYSIIFRIRLPK